MFTRTPPAPPPAAALGGAARILELLNERLPPIRPPERAANASSTLPKPNTKNTAANKAKFLIGASSDGLKLADSSVEAVITTASRALSSFEVENVENREF